MDKFRSVFFFICPSTLAISFNQSEMGQTMEYIMNSLSYKHSKLKIVMNSPSLLFVHCQQEQKGQNEMGVKIFLYTII